MTGDITVKGEVLISPEIRFSFVNKLTGFPVSYNDVLKVLKNYVPIQIVFDYFHPRFKNRKFACCDTTNTKHNVKHQIKGIKLTYIPKTVNGLMKAILDFSEAKPVPCDEDVAMPLQFYHITEN